MKNKFLPFVLLLMTCFTAFAQESVNLIVFSEDGDPFYAYVNGIRQNEKPETNIRVTGISPNVSLRIEFDNKALPQLKKNMPLEPGMEHTVRIRRDAKNGAKLTYFGQTEIPATPPQGVTNIQYHTQSDAPAQTSTSGGNMGSTSSTTMTSTSSSGTTDNVNVSMNVGGMGGAGITMNVNTNMPTGSMTTTTSQTVSSSSSSSYSGSDDTYQQTGQQDKVQTTTKAGCSVAMAPGSFESMKKSVESKPFSDTKMSTAKLATKNNCVSSAQVKEICKLFSMDDDKLEYAKYAYDYCVDKGNYYTVSEVFSFSATTDEFNKFLDK